MGLFDIFKSKEEREHEEKVKNVKKSLMILASNYNCSPELVKVHYLSRLKSKISSKKDIEKIIQITQEKCFENAVAFNMPPSHTPAAILLDWTKEYLSDYEEEDDIEDIIQGILKNNPDLNKAVQSGNKANIEAYLNNNPEEIDNLVNKITKNE